MTRLRAAAICGKLGHKWKIGAVHGQQFIDDCERCGKKRPRSGVRLDLMGVTYDKIAE